MTERRNYAARAAILQRLIEQVQRTPRGVQPDALQEGQVPLAAAERILKRLALRGLVRVVAGRWVPQPVLLAEVELRGEDAPGMSLATM